MTIDDPFAEPDDSERTVIRPNPGGRRPVEAMPSAPAQPMAFAPPPAATGKPIEIPPLKGLNPPGTGGH